jgi:hypothetical protein
MKCPALLVDAGTGNCSHSKLLAMVTVIGVLLVFIGANLFGKESITGWEAAVGFAMAAMANAQASKYLSKDKTPTDTPTRSWDVDPAKPAPFSEETK